MKNKTQTVEDVKDALEDLVSTWELEPHRVGILRGFVDSELRAFTPNSQIQQSNEDYLTRLEAIETITSTDFMELASCKFFMNNGRDKDTFTQEEAQEMVRALTDIYLIAHGGVSNCCKGKHMKLVEQYKLEKEGKWN